MGERELIKKIAKKFNKAGFELWEVGSDAILRDMK